MTDFDEGRQDRDTGGKFAGRRHPDEESVTLSDAKRKVRPLEERLRSEVDEQKARFDHHDRLAKDAKKKWALAVQELAKWEAEQRESIDEEIESAKRKVKDLERTKDRLHKGD